MGLICKFFLGTPDSVAGLGKLVPDRRHRPTSHTDMRRLSVGISSSGPINSRRTFALLWISRDTGWRGSGGRGVILQRTLVSSSGYPAA